jgi:hypothetical protein
LIALGAVCQSAAVLIGSEARPPPGVFSVQVNAIAIALSLLFTALQFSARLTGYIVSYDAKAYGKNFGYK